MTWFLCRSDLYIKKNKLYTPSRGTTSWSIMNCNARNGVCRRFRVTFLKSLSKSVKNLLSRSIFKVGSSVWAQNLATVLQAPAKGKGRKVLYRTSSTWFAPGMCSRFFEDSMRYASSARDCESVGNTAGRLTVFIYIMPTRVEYLRAYTTPEDGS